MANAIQWAGITQGLANVAKDMREKPLRDERMAEAKASRSFAEAKLNEYQGGKQLRQSQQELELEQTKQELRTIQANSLKKDTYSAFDKYEQDRDIKHLNRFISDAKGTTVGAKVYQDITRMDAVTRTPQTEAMLTQAGIADLNGYFENPNENGNFVLATGPDGKQKLVDIDKVYAATGYTQYADKQAIENMTTRAIRNQLAQSGMLYKDMTAMERSARVVQKELGIPYNEALSMVQKGTSKSSGSALERIAEELRSKNPEMTYPESLEAATKLTKSGSTLERETDKVMQENPKMSREEAIAIAKERTQPSTSAQKNLEAAKEVTTQLDEAAGGDYFAADLNDVNVRRRVGPLITELEKLTGQSLSTEDKRVARGFRELTHLGDVSAEITDEETGLFDNLLHGVKQYISDNVTGVEATTAYETIRNAVRHDLFGATLPAGELRAFNKSLGSLGKQTGPVLKQLQLSMQSIKTKLKAIYDMNDERIAQYYLGTSLEDVDKVIEKIDMRIKQVSNIDSKPLTLQSTVPQGEFQKLKPEEKKQALDSLFSGSSF